MLDPSLVVELEPAVTVAPVVPTLPLMVNVGAVQEAVKFTPVMFAEVIVTELEDGENVQPLLLGVTVYVPAARALMVKLLEPSLVADCAPALTVAPDVPALPEMENVTVDVVVIFDVQISSFALFRRSVHEGKNELPYPERLL